MGRYKIIILITIIFFIAKRNWNKSTCRKFFQKFVSREKFGFLQKSSSSSGVSSVQPQCLAIQFLPFAVFYRKHLQATGPKVSCQPGYCLTRGLPLGRLPWMTRSVAILATMLSYFRWTCPYRLYRTSILIWNRGDSKINFFLFKFSTYNLFMFSR